VSASTSLNSTFPLLTVHILVFGPSNPTALSRSVLFAEVAVHTNLETCQCLDVLPGNLCAPVYLALVGSIVLALWF